MKKLCVWRALPVALLFVVPVAKAQTATEQTFTFTATTPQGDAEAMVALRNMLDPAAKADAGATVHTVVVHGTPDQLLLAQKIVADLNSAREDGTAQPASAVFQTQKTLARRDEVLDSVAEQTFYLGDDAQQNQGVMTALRGQLAPEVKISLVPGAHAIVMRATPEQLAQAGKMIQSMDTAAVAKGPQASSVFVPQGTHTDDLVEQTFYLSRGSQPNSVTMALRNLIDPNVKIFMVASRGAIVLVAPADQLALVGKILDDLAPNRAGSLAFAQTAAHP